MKRFLIELKMAFQEKWKDIRRLLRIGVRVGAYPHISRKAILDTSLGGSIKIGKYCSINDFAMLLTYGGQITIGDNCGIHPFSILYGHGGLTIGNGVRIAAHVVIIPANHNFDDPNQFIFKQGVTSRGVSIGDDVWIGAGARILDGVNIGKGAVVACGAVVKDDVTPFAIVGGIPAKILRFRGDQQTIEVGEK